MVDASLPEVYRTRIYSDIERRSREFEKVLENFWAERSAKNTYISSTTIDLLRILLTKELEFRFDISRESMLEILAKVPQVQSASLAADFKNIALQHLDQQRKNLTQYFAEQQKKILQKLFSPFIQTNDDPFKEPFRMLRAGLIQDIDVYLSKK